MPFLELSKVSKSFNGASVLKDINLSIEKGEFVAIVGFSGAGKTTLISLIAGLLKPDSGTVKLNDLETTEPGPDRGIVFQNYSLLPWLTVFENVLLAVDQVNLNWSAAKKAEHVEQYIGMVNLTPARDKRPGELSGGMRQRVSVAHALDLAGRNFPHLVGRQKDRGDDYQRSRRGDLSRRPHHPADRRTERDPR